MKIILISSDREFSEKIGEFSSVQGFNFSNLNENKDPLDIMSSIISANPSLIIIDDDFLTPDTARILKSIRKVNNKTSIIFLTSNNSYELGREVSQIGIEYYGIKPISINEIEESILSIKKHKNKNQKIIN